MNNQKPIHDIYFFKLEEPGKVITDFQNLIGDVYIFSASGTMHVFVFLKIKYNYVTYQGTHE